MMDKPILLKGMQIYSEKNQFYTGYIKITNQKISEIGRLEDLQDITDAVVFDLQENLTAVPGFIDVHIHGAAGADVMDGTESALMTMANTLPAEGTTSFLATTMTQEQEEIEKALKSAAGYMSKPQPEGRAEILGVHLEGPFVNKEMAGAQPSQYIIDPDVELFKKWENLSQGNIKLVTLAPERPGGKELASYLSSKSIVASIGHSNATYEEVKDSIEAGCTHVTHLFNQMRGLHHREPGVAGAALLHDELMVEVIADGVHVKPEMVKLAFKQKGEEGLILITDSMRAKCLKNGQYDLGGQDVTVADGKAVLQDGTLAGSILRLGHAVKNMIEFTGCSLEDAIQMASVNPAKQLGVFDRKGSLAAGKDADIVILNEEHDVVMTLCRGEVAYRKENE